MTTATEVERVTEEKALTTLRDVVAERPEYVYSAPEYMKDGRDDGMCYYVHTDETGELVSAGCVVGVVLNRLGIPLDVLAEEEERPAYRVVARLFPEFSKRALNTFNDVQMSQDEGEPWGTAYAKATGETI
ncbi:hypothetical protein ACG2OD_14420 [Streptomyces sp. PDY-4]|uniref:hypothetical protein n=1 Tax=Streptomyces sp. PDY-4 TaxID=3376070 RepID=UPI0037BC54C3